MQIIKNSLKSQMGLTSIYGIGMIAVYLLSILIAKNYGAEGIGIYSISSRILTLLTLIAVSGTNIAVLRNLSKLNQSKNSIYVRMFYDIATKRVLILSFFLSIILYISSSYISNEIFQNKNYESAFKLIAFLIPFSAIAQLNKDFLRGLKLFMLSETLRNLIVPLINILIVIISIYLSYNMLITPIYGLAFGVITVCIFSLFYILNKHKKSYTSIDGKYKNDFLKSSFLIFQGQILALLNAQITLYFLEIFSSTENVGIFHVHHRIAVLCIIPLTISNVQMGPKMSELFKHKKLYLKKLLNTNVNIIFPLSMIIGLIIIISSNTILGFFGEEFNQKKIILYSLIFSQVFSVFCGPSTLFLLMTGFEDRLRRNMIAVLIFSIFSNYFLISNFDVIGAGLAFALNIIFLNTCNAVTIKYLTNFQTFFNPLRRSGN